MTAKIIVASAAAAVEIAPRDAPLVSVAVATTGEVVGLGPATGEAVGSAVRVTSGPMTVAAVEPSEQTVMGEYAPTS